MTCPVISALPANAILISLVITFGFVMYYKHVWQYWKKRKVCHIEEPRYIFGTLPARFPFNKHLAENMKLPYKLKTGQGYKHAGGFLFSTPMYVPLDPEYVKNILQRGFDHFTDRGFYYNERDDPLSANLFALGGDRWKLLRAKLSPAFTPGKLKMMLDNILKCADQMRAATKEICENEKTVNIKDLAECFTIDVIGSCAFGLECNSFKNPEAEFRKQGNKVFYFTVFRTLKTVVAFAFPSFGRWLGIALFDKGSNNFFTNIVQETLQYRKINTVVRKDFLQLLLELGEDGEAVDEPKLSIEELAAQAFIFFAAGFETSSLTLTFCLYELALNSEIQAKAREEINQVLTNHKGEITYDAIADMQYLNQIVEETLRKYPPVPFITRECVKNYQVPGTELVIEKGISAIIAILAIHHYPEYYPEPDNFDPESFSEENKRKRHPFTFLPFGEGPRICIGLRFGQMQTKVGLVNLLKHFRFALNKKTDVPLKIEPYSFTLKPRSEIMLDVEKITS